MSRQKRSLLVSFLIGFLILVWLDQWTKGLAVRFLKNQEPVAVIKGVFEFSYLENRGAAFGMLQNRQFFFFLIGIAVLAAILYMMWRINWIEHQPSKLRVVSSSLTSTTTSRRNLVKY